MIQNHGFAKFSVTGLDTAVARSVAETVVDFIQEYPQLDQFITELNVDRTLQAVASARGSRSQLYQPFKFSLNLNPVELADDAAIKRVIDINVRAGHWTPKDGAKDIIKHEMTHMLEYQQSFAQLNISPKTIDPYEQQVVLNAMRAKKFATEVADEAFANLGIQRTTANMARYVSNYGASDPSELLAETVGSSVQNSMMLEIIKTLKGKLK